MNAIVKKCLWLVEEIIKEGPPRMVSDIERTTGIDYRVIHDCVYELVQQGLVRIAPDSKLVWVIPNPLELTLDNASFDALVEKLGEPPQVKPQLVNLFRKHPR